MVTDTEIRSLGWVLYDNDVNKNSPGYTPVYKYVEAETWYLQMPTSDFRDWIIRKIINTKQAVPIFVGQIPDKSALIQLMQWLSIRVFHNIIE